MASSLLDCQERIRQYWQVIKSNCDTIYIQRKQFFEDRKKFENKQQKLSLLLNKLNDDCFIFTIPGKFPEAYHKTIDELIRRKAYNIALDRLCTIF